MMTALEQADIGTHVRRAGFLCLALLLLDVAAKPAILSVQEAAIGEHPLNLMILYPQHGIKLIAAWMWGWWLVPYLIPFILWKISGAPVTPETLPVILATVFFVASAPLAFSVLRGMGVDVRRIPELRLNWRVLALLGLVSSLMNVAVVHSVFYSHVPAELHLTGVVVMLVGDMLGLMAVLLTVMLAFRWTRLAT
jgi:hypothetical protein